MTKKNRKSWKDILVYFIVVAVVAFIWQIVEQGELNSSGSGSEDIFNTYSDEYLSIDYPSYMDAFEDPKGIAHILFATKKDFPITFVILFGDNKGESLDAITKKDASSYGVINQIGISEENISVSGIESNKIVYSYEQDPETMGLDAGEYLTLNITRISIKIGDEQFVQLRIIGFETTYNEYVDDINRMINSLNIKKFK
jgi:hypothetical protein